MRPPWKPPKSEGLLTTSPHFPALKIQQPKLNCLPPPAPAVSTNATSWHERHAVVEMVGFEWLSDVGRLAVNLLPQTVRFELT